MKTRFRLTVFCALAMALCATALTGCTKPDEEVVEHDRMGQFDGTTLVGRWRLDKLMADVTDLGNGRHTMSDDTEETDETYRDFLSDGTVRIYIGEQTVSGSYEYDAESHQLLVTVFGDVERMTVHTLTQSTLIVSAVYRDESTQEIDTFTYSRQ